ncbi:manganese efflux pump MntP family protein [Bacillus sp. JCM 19034]|uniref:manganese efflux pump MntP n=1 Tax=Bacillus sp. JCM 19034 TaxID=1481928 RepID=UPI000780D129|nr:manganese efflux pump MntP family protein [Bacillus sp. JCM 19034]
MEEWVTLMIMACALGMDAFSVSLGMGMAGLRLMQIFRIGLVIGAFHVIMPLLGIVTGKWLAQYVGMIAHYVGGGLLLVIGTQMVVSAFRKEEESLLQPVGFGLFLFALSVSVDSFSAGLSLGILGAKTIVTVAMIGFMSMVLAWVGLLIGVKFQRFIGSYSELLGGFILLGFGGKILFI